jgi:dihydroorotase
MLGLETALSVVVGLGVFTWAQLAERMSTGPARIAGLSEHGRKLAPGEPASITLVDPAARWTVDPATLASRSRNTPFAGHAMQASVVATFLRGRPTVLDGKLA